MSRRSSAESFEDFMSRALMDPVKGYYSRKVAGIGARGDFATSASIGEALARGIADWLKHEMRRDASVRTVIEIGGGEGALMKEVRRDLGWWTRRQLRWIMVERSEPLKAKQEALLGQNVHWHASLEAALQACDGNAFIWHNEFLDALPFSLVQWCGEDRLWREIWLRDDGTGKLREELRPIERWNVADFSITREWGEPPGPPSDKQRGEAHTGIRQWMSEWAHLWRSGAMLCLDYGDLFPALYHRRPRGTARAYLLHQRLEGAEIYQNIGRQDMTSDINFTDLRRWCLELGLEEAGYGTQADFLGRKSRMPSTAADRFVANPDGAGSAFKYLVVRPTRASEVKPRS